MNPDEAEEIRKEVEVELGAISTNQGVVLYHWFMSAVQTDVQLLYPNP
jgi:hypothetical protein